MSSLTPEQLKAVTFLPHAYKKHLIIEAGAGAGKTTVLGERVQWLLTKTSLTPNQIFMVTFTNDAQKELKEKVQAKVQNNSHLIHISTIDSLFDSLVESIFPLWWEKINLFQIPPILTLISESEIQRNLEKKVALLFNENRNSSYELALILDFILSGGFKKSNVNFFSPTNTLENILKCMCQDHFLSAKKEDIRIASNKIHPATYTLIEQIHTIARLEYEKRIQKGEFTYADKTVFLKENIKNKCPIFMKELIVDEYQDTNFLQHEILSRLVNNSKGRMVVVGDPKQSIYGFRGASVSVFKSLLEDKEWEHIVLNKNFRTQKNLLHEINALSKLAFSWQNPRHPVAYINSFFYEEAQKKYIGENPLIPGENTIKQDESSPNVYIVSASIPPKTKDKIKINDTAPLAYADFLNDLKVKENFSWNEVVVLCEKNKQIKKNIDLKLGIETEWVITNFRNEIKNEIAKFTNRNNKMGSLQDVIVGADVFIGVSAEGALTKEMVKTMSADPIIFAMANPNPEISPSDAKAAGAAVIGTGRSDYPNQVNNVLAFPGIFRGALDVRATHINEQMKVAAVEAIASLISEAELSADNVIPNPFDPRVAPTVAAAVAKAAMETGVARIKMDPEDIKEKTRKLASIGKSE